MVRIPLLACLFAAAVAALPAQTVIVVRHADRAGQMVQDAGLSEAGRCRAQVLAKMLAPSGVTRIYATEVARTQQTAEPLARELHLKPEIVPAKDTAALVGRLRAAPPTSVVLVVAHGNTLPEIVKQLSGETIPPLAETEYDRLYIVTLGARGHADVLLLRYPGCTR